MRVDLKRSLVLLRGQVEKDPEQALMPYFLFLDFFRAEQGGGSLLVLGHQPKLTKLFKQLKKTAHKVQLSWGSLRLDAQGQLYFVPLYRGRQVKVPALAATLKTDPIKGSMPGFWSKCRRTNVHLSEPIGDPSEEEQETNNEGMGGTPTGTTDESGSSMGGTPTGTADESGAGMSGTPTGTADESGAMGMGTPPTDPRATSPAYQQMQQQFQEWQDNPATDMDVLKERMPKIRALLDSINQEYKTQGKASLQGAYQGMADEAKRYVQQMIQQSKKPPQKTATEGLAAVQAQALKLKTLLQNWSSDSAS